MPDALVRDLADCSAFRQTLLARPPAALHATAALPAALLGVALTWLALTDADLVVRAAGRVRPIAAPARVVCTGSGESLSASPGGVVAEVCFREGAVVRRGDVLLRLDTGRLDIERAKRRQTVRAGEEELAKGAELLASMYRQFEADRAVGKAELEQAREEVRSAHARRELAIRLAESELKQATREADRLLGLAAGGAGSAAERDKAVAAAEDARTSLAKARLPVEEGKVEVLRRRLEQAPENHAAKRRELEMRLAVRRGEVEAARRDLEELERERGQATLVAPCDGVVTSGEVKVGDVLERGKAVVEIAEQHGFLFEAVVPSEEVGRLQVGLPVRVKLDAFDYQKYGAAAGRVVFIAPDSSAPEGKRAATYLVRVELDGDEVGRGPWQGRVKLGMAGQAEIVTGRESLLSLLARKIRQSISLG